MAQLTLQPAEPPVKRPDPRPDSVAEPNQWPTHWESAPASTLAHRALLQRVVQSSSFAKSEKLGSFLTYVCEMALKGRGREINEQRIGQAVFGRSRDYDSAVDGIVRTQASRVRQRLEQYFENEGSFEPVRIVIPRGGYVPIFEDRTVAEPDGPSVAPLEQSPTPLNEVSGARIGWWLAPWVMVGLLSVALIFTILVQQGVISISPAVGPTTHPLWGQLLMPGKPTMLVTADSGLVLYENATGKMLTLDEYLHGDYAHQGPSDTSPNQLQSFLPSQLAQRRYTSVVDLEITAALIHMADERKAQMPIRYARDVRPNDLKAGDMILLGTSEGNPWVELFEQKMNYIFHDDVSKRVFSVYDRGFGTAVGQSRWDSAVADPQHRVYAVAAFLPNLTGTGNTLILEGTSMAGTEAAWDFVSDDAQLLPFLTKIRKPDGSIPHFEVLLENNNLSASAVRSTILGWRVEP